MGPFWGREPHGRETRGREEWSSRRWKSGEFDLGTLSLLISFSFDLHFDLSSFIMTYEPSFVDG